MKFFTLITIFALIAGVFANLSSLTPKQRKTLQQYVVKCKKEVTITNDEIKTITKPELSNATPEIKCFIRCLLEKIGFLKDDAVQEDFVLKKLVPTLGVEKTNEVIAKCNGLKISGGPCNAALQIFKCYKNQVPDIFQLLN